MKNDAEAVVSKETLIKPSTPTPHHLRRYQFSFVDQLTPPIYVPLIYFYNNVVDDQKQSHHENISQYLKTSLSTVLTSYYPLAGRIKDNNFVDCNDEGVPFIDAQVNCKLSQLIQDPQVPRELYKFLPTDREETLLVIQLNFFDCGSIAIGALISHKIADALSAVTFIKNWAATARGECHSFSPEFVGAQLFPPKAMVQFVDTISTSDILDEANNIVTMRLVFSGSTIAAMREMYAHSHRDGTTGIRPTRVEIVSSFIWSRFAASNQPESSCILSHTVNLRKRMDQPLADDSFGNIVGMAMTISSEEDNADKFFVLVKKFRDAISQVNMDYVKKMHQGIGVPNLQNKDVVRFCFTSFCRFPVYETDFGWGRPIWVAPVGWLGIPYGNIVVLIDTESGDGIEAWILLKDEDMAKFAADKEILALLSSTSLT